MRYFGIGFLVFGALEILSLIQVGARIGAFGTLALIILSAMAGSFMLRRFGLSGVLLAAAAVRGGGQVSAYQLLWPVRYAVAALLLISPGFFSTLRAVLLMLPLKAAAPWKPSARTAARHRSAAFPKRGRRRTTSSKAIFTPWTANSRGRLKTARPAASKTIADADQTAEAV